MLDVDGVKVVVEMKDVANPKLLAEIADRIKGKLGDPSVIVLGTKGEGRVNLLVAATPARDRARREGGGDRQDRRAQVVGGGGGGRDNMAQAGGRDPDKLPDALRRGGTGDPASPGLSTRVVALDYGSARCGVAVSDPTRTLATPVEPVLAPATRRGFGRLVARIGELEAAVVVVGLPLSLSGRRFRPDARDPRIRPAVEGSAQRAD